MTNLKKTISILLSVSIIMSIFAFSDINAFADENDFKYSVINGSAVINGYTGNAKSLDIPEKLGGFTVTKVDANTFFYAKELENVNFPGTVTNISPSVFQGYVNIKEISVDDSNKNYSSKDGALFNKSQSELIIYPKGNERTSYTIPETVETICSFAFYGAENLSGIVIPNSVKTIEYYAFESCTSITEITLPASVSSIGDLAFYRCYSLENIMVNEANKVYSSENGVLFNKAKTNLISYPSANVSISYAVPETVENISAFAFDSAKNLLAVTLPEKLEAVGSNAFKNCTSLSDITVPESVKNVDSGAFHGCTALVSVKLPSSLSRINDDTFYNCINLNGITIPSTVKYIGRHAFENCQALTEVVIPSGVTEIGASAFNNCINLADISFPMSVISIGNSAFNNCAANASVKYAGSKTDWQKIRIGADNTAFNTNMRFGKLHFTDLKGYEVYNDYVEYTSLYNEYITGTNPPERTLFSPEGYVTRAMFVTILYRMAGEPYNNGKNPHKRTPFTDISNTSVYYYNAACWALDNDITNQKTFKPNQYVSREQTATFLFRYAKENNMIENDDYKSVKLSQFPDYRKINSWSYEAMQWANYNAMITGTQQGYANPQGFTKRIHASKILYGFGKACTIGNFE